MLKCTTEWFLGSGCRGIDVSLRRVVEGRLFGLVAVWTTRTSVVSLVPSALKELLDLGRTVCFAMPQGALSSSLLRTQCSS